MIKKAAKLTKSKCGILIDLQGPIIRTGDFVEGKSVSVPEVCLDVFLGEPQSRIRIQVGD